MTPKSNLYTSKAPLNALDDRAVPKGATQTASTGFRDDTKNPSPLVDFMPFVEDSSEKSEFWRALIITLVVFAGIGALGVGFVLSQRLNSPPETMALTPQYIDSSPNTVSAKATPTKAPISSPPGFFGSSNSIDLTVAPTPRPTSQFPSGVPSSFVPFFVNPFSTQSATLLSTSGTTTPTSSVTGGVTTSPSPTGSITITVTMTITPTPTATISPTQTPTPVNTSTPTPTPEAYLTTNIVNDTLAFGSRDILDGATTQTFNIYNVNDVSFVVNKIDFATTGPYNPYSVLEEDTCLTNTSLPVTMSVGQSKCVKVQIEPTAQTNNTNYLLIFWYTWRSSNVKVITLTADVTTPTPTSTVTPTPTPESYLTTNVIGDSISFGTRPLAAGATTQTFNLYNVNDVDFVVNKLDFATTGPLNPYSILAEDGCISNVSLPVTMSTGDFQCVKVEIDPGTYTINTNYLLIFWYTWRSSNVKVITLTADVTTPTPTPLPETPTPTP